MYFFKWDAVYYTFGYSNFFEYFHSKFLHCIVQRTSFNNPANVLVASSVGYILMLVVTVSNVLRVVILFSLVTVFVVVVTFQSNIKACTSNSTFNNFFYI